MLTDERWWQVGDRLRNRADQAQAIVFKADRPGMTLVLSGGGILIGKQNILERDGWERIYASSETEDTETRSSSP